jgi:hypothetical protein
VRVLQTMVNCGMRDGRVATAAAGGAWPITVPGIAAGQPPGQPEAERVVGSAPSCWPSRTGDCLCAVCAVPEIHGWPFHNRVPFLSLVVFGEHWATATQSIGIAERSRARLMPCPPAAGGVGEGQWKHRAAISTPKPGSPRTLDVVKQPPGQQFKQRLKQRLVFLKSPYAC